MSPDDVLDFWFGAPGDDGDVQRRQQALWWGKEPALDRAIGERFAAVREQAVAGALEPWSATPRGRLALIILIDQFSRNLYRNDGRAFAHDALARHWCREGLALRADRELTALERMFFYLPLEHSEDLADQELSVELFDALAREHPAVDVRDYARRHRDIIARFGRFPHRNAALGRASTPPEIEFLRQPGSSF